MQSSSQIITTNKPTPSFLQAGCPSCHPTNSIRALKRSLFNNNNDDGGCGDDNDDDSINICKGHNFL